jgi:hypothetical protein
MYLLNYKAFGGLHTWILGFFYLPDLFVHGAMWSTSFLCSFTPFPPSQFCTLWWTRFMFTTAFIEITSWFQGSFGALQKICEDLSESLDTDSSRPLNFLIPKVGVFLIMILMVSPCDYNPEVGVHMIRTPEWIFMVKPPLWEFIWSLSKGKTIW